jgi:hypothetical protein
MNVKHWTVLVGLLVAVGMHLQGAHSWAELTDSQHVGELLIQIATVVGALYVQPPAGPVAR